MDALGAYSGSLVFAALLFGVVAIGSSDLAVDIIHVRSSALPGWIWKLTAPQAARHGLEPRQARWMRRAFDCVLIAVGFAEPVLVLRPSENSDLATRVIWSLFLLICLGWFVRLIKMPRA
jgi:hypothetical protein